MRRFTGACFVACAGTVALGACNRLEPFTPDAGGPTGVTDSSDGFDVNRPVEDAKAPEDTGGGDVVGGDGGDGGPPKKRVFVTSTTGTGAFAATGALALGAADLRCQTAANAANLKGTFVAWISTANPAVTAISRITQDVGPWTLVNGAQVFANKAAITTTGPEVPIDKDETGKQVPAPDTVWTGTQQNGSADGQNCASWTNGTVIQNGRLGSTKDKTATWTQAQNQNCNAPQHVYCFEQ